jgi:transposase
MDRMTHIGPGQGIVVGVDTHRDSHVAVALDAIGGRLGERAVATTRAGYAELDRWARSLGPVRAFGIEGTGSYGAALARHLRAAGHLVREVDRPDRSARRRLGKSDPIDAELAARAVLAGTATTLPKAADGSVEMLRMLVLTKRSAHEARTAARLQLRALLVTAPAELREQLGDLSRAALLDRCAALRPGPLVTPLAVTRHSLRLLARRSLALGAEIGETEARIEALVTVHAPALLATYGVGPDCAATLLVAAGDDPDRLASEAAFAGLCGVNPIPASSGRTQRHRLDRGGDRQADAALYRIVVVRMRHHAPTRAYVARRTTEGRTKREIMRCLKRYAARELFPLIIGAGLTAIPAEPRIAA